MIKITSTESAKIYFKGSTTDALSVVLFVHFASRNIGKMSTSIVSYSAKEEVAKENQLLVDLSYEIISEDVKYKYKIDISYDNLPTNGEIPSLSIVQDYWKAKLEEAGYIAEVF